MWSGRGSTMGGVKEKTTLLKIDHMESDCDSIVNHYRQMNIWHFKRQTHFINYRHNTDWSLRKSKGECFWEQPIRSTNEWMNQTENLSNDWNGINCFSGVENRKETQIGQYHILAIVFLFMSSKHTHIRSRQKNDTNEIFSRRKSRIKKER